MARGPAMWHLGLSLVCDTEGGAGRGRCHPKQLLLSVSIPSNSLANPGFSPGRSEDLDK